MSLASMKKVHNLAKWSSDTSQKPLKRLIWSQLLEMIKSRYISSSSSLTEEAYLLFFDKISSLFTLASILLLPKFERPLNPTQIS